jgi:ParB-like chromosome segregation protein Spo0J
VTTIPPAVPESVFLLPNHIFVHSDFEVWGDLSDGGVEADGGKALRDLALSLDSVGQTDALKVFDVNAGDALLDPKYVVIAGHRRRRACLLVNEIRTREARPLLRLRCEIADPSDADVQTLLKRALHSNHPRRAYTALHLANLALRVGVQFPGDLRNGCKRTARYLALEPVQVKSAIQLHNTLAGETRRKVLSGELSVQSAQLIGRKTGLDPFEQEAVLLRARAIQTEDAIGKYQSSPTKPGAAAAVIEKIEQERIELPAVKKALAERGASTKKTVAEVREFFRGFDVEKYGPEGSLVRLAFQYLAEVWLPGAGSDAAARRRLEGIFGGK